jgi:hypothetical protein
MLGTVFGHAPSKRRFTVISNGSRARKEYNYIIVGAGTAGLAVADRL